MTEGSAGRAPLTDVAAGLGRHPRTGVGAVSVEKVLATMDHFGITSAVVYSLMSRWHAPMVGNHRLVKQLAGFDRLYPCWTVLPDSCGETLEPENFVAQADASGVVAVRAFPADHGYRLDGPDMAPLHSALATARLPLLVEISQTTWQAVEAVASRFGDLTVIVGDVGYRTLRTVVGVLTRCPNVHVDLSYLASHCGLEWLVEQFGADRFLLGTGWPLRDPADAITRLLWSELDDAVVARIGSVNAHRLLGLGATR